MARNRVLRWVPVLALLAAGFAGTGAAGRAPYETHSIGAKTIYQTPYYVFDGRAPGPTVLIEAGIHGNELAGTAALDDLLTKIRVHSGRVIVLPRMNKPADERHVRYINLDLNRSFVDRARETPYEYPLARAIFDLAKAEHASYVITLHESAELHDAADPSRLGQSICYGTSPKPAVLEPWLARLNATIADARERFVASYFPIPTSSTEVMVAQLALKGGFCVETWSGLPWRERVHLQWSAVDTFLTTLGIAHDYAKS